jgi:hypothetical protein
MSYIFANHTLIASAFLGGAYTNNNNNKICDETIIFTYLDVRLLISLINAIIINIIVDEYRVKYIMLRCPVKIEIRAL